MTFLSRGDNSGTHKKEMAIWNQADVRPSGDWYVIINDFMMATLRKADAMKVYFMTASSTGVAAKKDLNNLAVHFKGDPFIVNTYHGLCQLEGATPDKETHPCSLIFWHRQRAKRSLPNTARIDTGRPCITMQLMPGGSITEATVRGVPR
jgi:hypothetical protein